MALSFATRSGLAMVSVLVLARLLEPKAFGLVALASMLVLVVQYTQGAGIASALIYRRDDVKRAAATVLVFSSLAGLPLYAATYFLAPLFADAVNAPGVTEVLRVLGIIVVIQGLGVAPGAILERELNFHLKARARRRRQRDAGGGRNRNGVRRCGRVEPRRRAAGGDGRPDGWVLAARARAADSAGRTGGFSVSCSDTAASSARATCSACSTRLSRTSS